MKMKFGLVVLLGAMLFISKSAFAGGEGWMSDFEAAKAKAEKEGKDLLLDFTGSDWCGWCIKLNKEVFSQDAFKNEAPKHFILVELDYPRKKELPADLKKQNDKLQAEYQIQGYPTIYLTDAKGRVYARTGYQQGGPEKYNEHLAELRGKKAARDEMFAKAEKAQGAEKAKALDEALTKLDEMEACVGYSDVFQQIIDADSDNKAGLKSKYELKQGLADVEQTLAKVTAEDKKPLDEALGKIDALITKHSPTGEAKQKLYYAKAMVLFNKEDMKAGVEALQTAHDAAPDSREAKQFAKMIENVKKMMEREGK